MKKSVEEKELEKLRKKETQLQNKKAKQEESFLNHFLETKIPVTLQSKLESAFFCAFKLVFSKGTAVIEKTYNTDKMQQDFDIRSYTADVRQTRKSIKSFQKGSRTSLNEFLSGASGVTLGAFGIGLPDIPLFISFILKSVYQISLNYGYDYTTDKEKEFILNIINASLLKGDDFQTADMAIDYFIENNQFKTALTEDENIRNVSNILSKELLYTKFLQGIPIVGAVGGSYDYIYIKRLTNYAKLKYYKRFLNDRQKRKTKIK